MARNILAVFRVGCEMKKKNENDNKRRSVVKKAGAIFGRAGGFSLLFSRSPMMAATNPTGGCCPRISFAKFQSSKSNSSFPLSPILSIYSIYVTALTNYKLPQLYP